MKSIDARLGEIIPKMKESKFIEGRGLGNEISFYVFDYEPEYELKVRDYVRVIKKTFNYDGTNRQILEFDLYDMLIDITKEKKIFDRIFEMEEKQGPDALFKAMITFAKPDIFLNKVKERLEVESINNPVIFLTGIGKVYPFVRSHTILNNLQKVLDKTPVIMFFPGTYDGQSLRLFGKFRDDNYYRAFRLVD